MNIKKKLKQLLMSNKAVIGIVGLGYVGLPLALRYCSANANVIGFDIDIDKISKLKKGKSYINQIRNSEIKNALKTGLKVTNDFKKIKSVDAIILCLPTPLDKYHQPDLSFIIKTINSIKPYLKKIQALSLESTTYPGTTEEIVLPLLKEVKKFTIGKDFFLIYSPEREDPGNSKFNTKNIPKIVAGHTANCLEIGKKLYQIAVDKIVPVSSTQTAEMTKLMENIYRSVNIGLVNEIKMLTEKMGIDVHEVIRAASTKPFGFTPYYPGPGLGGHCIPIDPFYLTWKAREFGFATRFIELAGEINSNMPEWVLNKLKSTLNKSGKSLKNSKILILGIAYKKNVDDVRESPGIKLLKLLKDNEAVVDYSDKYIPKIPRMRNYEFNLSNKTLTAKLIKKYDVLLLVTNHDYFDYEFIQKNAKTIVDTRGVYKKKLKNVVRA